MVKEVCEKIDVPAADQDPGGEQTLREQQITEIKQALVQMSIDAPVLEFNDNTDPHVWVNKNVNFYVKLGDAKTRKTSALNGEVQIEAVPVHYHIDTGNGESYNTYTAGGPIDLRETEEMPKTQTSYVYEKTGNFHAYVTVTYEGRFRFGSGPWIPITEKVSKRSGATLVRVWTSEVHSVAKTCDEDPTGWACPLNDKYRDFNNPNPKLRRPDPVTGQRWHKDDIGAGDTEWRLHPKWPDM